MGGTLIILGITATRGTLTNSQVQALYDAIYNPEVTEVHHGDCVGGDEDAHFMAVDAHKRIIIHPPVKDALRANCARFFVPEERLTVLEPKLYMERNHDIVDACDFLLALPGTTEEIVRSGTWATIRYARKIRRPHLVVTP